MSNLPSGYVEQPSFEDIIAEKDAWISELHEALSESVKLQSHYASILNAYDGGRRLPFADAEEWIKRLSEASAVKK